MIFKYKKIPQLLEMLLVAIFSLLLLVKKTNYTTTENVLKLKALRFILMNLFATIKCVVLNNSPEKN
jgi:hypothetical protein